MPIEIISAKDYSDLDSRNEFYKSVFPDRGSKSIDYWNWLYNGSLNKNDYPLLAIDDDVIIGQAGGIPIEIKIQNSTHQTAWFNDFNILPKYQGKGIGKILSQAWMNKLELGVTFCNDNSMQVFKKYGWEESFQTNFHTIFIKPFNHPKISEKVPSILGTIGNSMFQFTQVRKTKNISLIPTRETVLNTLDEPLGSVKDHNFWTWRLLNSPDSDHYYITERKSILKLCKNKYGNYIDVLFSYKLDDEFIEDLKELRYYGLNNGFDFMRLLCPNEQLSSEIKRIFRSYITHPRFAFFANDERLKNEMREASWNWQLIDSDFEKFL